MFGFFKPVLATRSSVLTLSLTTPLPLIQKCLLKCIPVGRRCPSACRPARSSPPTAARAARRAAAASPAPCRGRPPGAAASARPRTPRSRPLPGLEDHQLSRQSEELYSRNNTLCHRTPAPPYAILIDLFFRIHATLTLNLLQVFYFQEIR